MDLNHLTIKVEPPDEELDPDHSQIVIESAAHTDYPGGEVDGLTYGEVHAARVRAKGVLARLAQMADGHIHLEARGHGCSPTWHGEPLGVIRHSLTGCEARTSPEADDYLADSFTLYIDVPTDRVDAWLEALRDWLDTIHQADTIDDPDKVIQ